MIDRVLFFHFSYLAFLSTNGHPDASTVLYRSFFVMGSINLVAIPAIETIGHLDSIPETVHHRIFWKLEDSLPRSYAERVNYPILSETVRCSLKTGVEIGITNGPPSIPH
jgi:hypothetical protein